MADHVRKTNITPFIFPSAVTILVFGSWVALAAVETCTPQKSDPIFDCWTSLQLVAIVAGIGSALAGLMALLARVVLYRSLPFVTRKPELISALLASVVLGIFFTSLGPWVFKLESIGMQFFCWLGASLVICGISLLVVKHWMMREVLWVVVLWFILTAGNCIPQQALVVYENPSEQYLNMTGVIDENLEYVVRVIYVKNAQQSGCPTYGKDSDICQTKPEEFTYVPQIDGEKHNVHIPLKELSPGANSWWEPWDIAICVGPKDPNAVPHKCQRLFFFTEDTHDGHQTIDLVCTTQFWCSEGLHVENVSELNHEYVVNIRKEQEATDPNTTTTVEIDQLLKDENWAAYIDRVLVDYKQEDTITLLMAANMAIHEQRLNDAMLLYHVGTIRADVDGKHYTPIKKGGESPAPAIQNLIGSTQSEIRAFLPDQLLQGYQASVPQLMQWDPHYTNTYDPGWESESVPNPQDVQMYFEEAKIKRIQLLQGFITLFENETYADAYEVVSMYEWDPTLDQQAEKKRDAEETMQRIEAELGIDGYMAGITKQRK